MASAVGAVEKGGGCVNSVTLSIGSSDAEKIAACIKSIAGGVSASDIVEIVLKTPVPAKEEKKRHFVN